MVFHGPQDNDRVKRLRRIVYQVIPVQSLGGKPEALNQVLQELLRLAGNRHGGDLNTAPARMLHETAPPAAHVEHAISRLQAAGLYGKIQLAALRSLRCLQGTTLAGIWFGSEG
jgi:hypothetical protein